MKDARRDRKTISDTVHITPDGAIVVDVAKLFQKEHVKRMMREMRSKIRIVHAEGKS